ncbi:MAG: lipocalin family protein [Bacteroidales bacterium]|nr:lipocalin family protein [Bacteroidales bacterium]
MKSIFVLTASALVTLFACKSCATIPRGAVAVRPFDTEKYLGRWYEIARMDFRFERNLNNTTAEYTLNKDGSIKVDNRGFNYVTGEWKQAIGKARPAGVPDEGRLKVSFFGPFYSPYNVIALDDDYQYALIAGKNLKYLWILSRQTTIPDETRLQYLKTARDLGYDTSALIWVSHDKSK